MSNLTGSDKYQALITEEKAKIEKAYTEIGRIYFESHKDSYEESFGALISEITNSFKAIADYEKEILAAKNVISCPSCKAELPSDSQFCIACGSPVTSAPEASASVPSEGLCPKCRATLIPGSKFCTTCGALVDSITTTSSSVSICHKCGKTLPLGTKFCTTCGALISQPTSPDVPSTQTASATLTCSKCGKSLEYGTKFCTTCGTMVKPEEAVIKTEAVPPVAAVPTCKNCGATFEEDAKFCTVCGAKKE